MSLPNTNVDTSNYYPFHDEELTGLEGATESEYISKILGRPVIKAFNNILEHTLRHKGKATGEEGRIAPFPVKFTELIY